MLEWGILYQKIPDFNLVKDKSNIIISTDNIGKDYRFSLGDVNVDILTPKEIEQKGKVESRFLYLRFHKFDIKKTSASVLLQSLWAPPAYLGGGQVEVRFAKKGNNWVRDDKTIRIGIY